MSPDDLRNAMRFGSKERLDRSALGKFGLGLKLASFSHARTLTVVSSRDRGFSGRRWTLEGIRRNWECETLSPLQAEDVCAGPWSPLNLRKNGTVVFWDHIDKLPVSSRGLRFTLAMLHRRLELHLGLHFHRFLQAGALKIQVDQQEHGEQEHQIRSEIVALDPFAYPSAAGDDYPRTFTARIAGVGEVVAEGHIWPPNSELPEYRLGNRAAARQGFYFYRNDRLIQAGGWNGLLQNEAEPHGSLARVRIDLPLSCDASFSLNVQKSSVIVPPGFVEAVQTAADPDGVTFESYRQTALQAYRNRDLRAIVRRTPVPGSGLPAQIAKEFGVHARGGEEETRSIALLWEEIEGDDFFRLDQEQGRLLLNARYRDKVLAGLDPEPDDVPLVKALIFCLLGADLMTVKSSVKRRRELARINRILSAAAGLERG
jgi:hypothetical protein